MLTRGIANIFRIAELRRRLFFTLGLLGVYRLGIFISIPGVNRDVMESAMQGKGGLLSLFNLFSGGALEQASIFGLGIMPYISASIIIQLLTVVIPALEKLQKEGELGRRKINQYTRYGAVILAVIQGLLMANMLQGWVDDNKVHVVSNPGLGFQMMAVVSLCAGTAFIMWLGEQITERGIGNGISLIIFAGIIAGLPSAATKTYSQFTSGQEVDAALLVILGALMVAVIATIIVFERGQRRIPVQYAKRVVGKKVYGGQATHLPLKVNSSGVIPPIFASSLLAAPATLGSVFPWIEKLNAVIQSGWVHNALYVGLIVFFAYFYTAVTFNPVDVADNMKKHGGYIPGIRPGKKTAEFIDSVLTRITFGGALYLAAVCVLPTIIMAYFKVPFYFGGTSLLIVVGVALDTVQQIEGHLITRNYEGFSGPRGPRIRGRSRMAV